MIKRANELTTEIFSNRFGGKGDISVTKIIENEQFQGKGRLFARQLLKPGCSLGWHEHKGDFEAYYILSGEGTLDDNGIKVQLKAGDVSYTNNGESHSIENTGTEDLDFIALILYV